MIDPDGRTPEVGVLGSGRMGSRLAAMFARAGRRVVLGSRDSDAPRRSSSGWASPRFVPAATPTR